MFNGTEELGGSERRLLLGVPQVESPYHRGWALQAPAALAHPWEGEGLSAEAAEGEGKVPAAAGIPSFAAVAVWAAQGWPKD